jgi:AraC-like DNA-binding protein
MLYHQSSNSKANYSYNTHVFTDLGFDSHFHKNPELIFVKKDEIGCTVNGKEYRLKEGNFGLCLPYDIHKYDPCDGCVYWVLVFSEDFVHLFSKIIEGKVGKGFMFRCDDSLQRYIEDNLISKDKHTVLGLKSCLYAICEQYLNQVELVKRNGNDQKLIASISDYVRDNHKKSISLSDLSRALGYEYSYMSRYFKSCFNMTFTELINVYRLESAIKLLHESDKSITEIAYESGFKSVRTFNCFFKKSTSVTPSEYRKKFKE